MDASCTAPVQAGEAICPAAPAWLANIVAMIAGPGIPAAATVIGAGSVAGVASANKDAAGVPVKPRYAAHATSVASAPAVTIAAGDPRSASTSTFINKARRTLLSSRATSTVHPAGATQVTVVNAVMAAIARSPACGRSPL